MASPAPEHFCPLRRVEYDQLVALRTFDGERIELVGGALRHMSPIGPPHLSTVDDLGFHTGIVRAGSDLATKARAGRHLAKTWVAWRRIDH